MVAPIQSNKEIAVKIKNVLSVVALFCMLSQALIACNLPITHPLTPPPSKVREDMTLTLIHPLNYGIYQVNHPINLVARVITTNPPNGLGTYFFTANNVPVGTNLVGNIEFNPYYVNGWTPTEPGEYYIQAHINIENSNSAISEPVRVCVMPFTSFPDDNYDRTGYTGPCQVPTRIPTHANTGDLTVKVVHTPDSVSYSIDCPAPSYVTFILTVDDPQDQVAFADIRLSDVYDHSHTHYLNWVVTRPGNQKEFRSTIHLDPDLFTRARQTDSTFLFWHARLFGFDGSQIFEKSALLSVEALHCSQHPLEIANGTLTPTPTDIQPLEIFPSQTSIQILTATATATPLGPPKLTFTKNAFCRKGPDQSFSDVTAILSGETVDILNVSQDGFWYYIYWAKFKAKCWVAAKTGQASGDAAGLTVLVGPALPKPNNPVDPSKPPEPASPVDPTSPPAPCNPLVRTCP